MPRILSSDPMAGDSMKPPSGRVLSSDPNAGDRMKGGATSQEASGTHPILAMLARLAGGVGSAVASPADITVAGTAIPAAIAGGSESLAEWLEGSPQDPKRIGMESAIGAIPFAKVVKEGSILAKMLKAGAIGGTSEGGRELAKGESLDPVSIATQAGLGAGTFGLLHSLMGLRGAKAPSAAPEVGPPVITREGDAKIFRMSPTPAPAGTAAPSPQAQHFFRENIRGDLEKSMNKIVPSGKDMVSSLDQAKNDALKIAQKNSAQATREGRALTSQEQTADMQQLRAEIAAATKRQAVADKATTAARLLKDAEKRGFVKGDPSFGTSESGKTASGVNVSKRTPLIDPNAETDDMGGGGRGSSRNPGYVPKNPLDELMKTLGMNPENTSRPGLPISNQPDAPWGGARLPITPPAKAGEWPSVAEPPATAIESQAVKTDPIGEPAPVAPQMAQDASGATQTGQSDSPLLRIFKSRQGATGANYRLAKDAVKAGEIPSADYARDTHLISLGKTPEGPLAPRAAPDLMDQFQATQGPKQSFDWPEVGGKQVLDPATGSHVQVPEVQGGMTEPPATNPDAGASMADDAPDWVKEQSKLVDENGPSVLDRLKGQSGAMNPALLKFLAGGTGAVIGAPVGAYLDPDDPNAALKGAAAGGVLGYAGSQGAHELINWRNAGLLGNPLAQGKKALSDIGTAINTGAEDIMSGQKTRGVNTLRELLRVPTNLKNLKEGMLHPELAEDVLGDAAKPAMAKTRDALGLVTRPFAGMQYATSQAMQRAGRTPDEARRALMLGSPLEERYKGDLLDKAGVYDTAQKLLDLQKYPVVRALRPFARIGTNIAVRGAQRVPGLSMFTGDPETRVARTLLGGGALAAGAIVGANDTADEEQGDESTAPWLRGLRRAALASYGVPFSIGEGLTGPHGIRDLYYMTPGVSATIPPFGPKDTATDFAKKFGKRWLDQMIPDWLNPEDTSSEAQR